MAVLSAPCQGNELHKQEAAHQREMALDMLSEIANVFDFPDLNRFLSVSWLVPFTTTSVGGCLYACGFLLSRMFLFDECYRSDNFSLVAVCYI